MQIKNVQPYLQVPSSQSAPRREQEKKEEEKGKNKPQAETSPENATEQTPVITENSIPCQNVDTQSFLKLISAKSAKKQTGNYPKKRAVIAPSTVDKRNLNKTL